MNHARVLRIRARHAVHGRQLADTVRSHQASWQLADSRKPVGRVRCVEFVACALPCELRDFEELVEQPHLKNALENNFKICRCSFL